MTFFSIEFWVIFQMVIFVILLFLMVFYIKKMKTSVKDEVSKLALEEIIEMLEPLLKEANETAQLFEGQIKEKSNLVAKLNEKLDSRIISLNLLLNRSETYLLSMEPSSGYNHHNADDQQESILSMHAKGLDSEQIAQKLSMPKGEVDLVINLKKMFVSME